MRKQKKYFMIEIKHEDLYEGVVEVERPDDLDDEQWEEGAQDLAQEEYDSNNYTQNWKACPEQPWYELTELTEEEYKKEKHYCESH